MREYIISVAGAAVLSAFVNMLSPEKWTKYISVITGLVIAICIGRPALELVNQGALTEIKLEVGEMSNIETEQFYAEVKAELEARLCLDIKERVKTEFGTECDAAVEAETDAAGRISAVKSITIYSDRLDNAAIGRLREVYGAKEVFLGGNKKLYKKAE